MMLIMLSMPISIFMWGDFRTLLRKQCYLGVTGVTSGSTDQLFSALCGKILVFSFVGFGCWLIDKHTCPDAGYLEGHPYAFITKMRLHASWHFFMSVVGMNLI